MSQGCSRRAGGLIRAAFVLIVLASGWLMLAWPVAAKEFALIATVDCGVKSGKPCPDGTTIIGVRTDQISGKLQTFKVDFGWVLKQAPRLHQDEEICVEVRDDVRTDGVFQAIAFIDKCDGPPRRIKKDEDDVPPAPAAIEEAGGPIVLPCDDDASTSASTVSTFLIEMFNDDGFAVLDFVILSGTVRFQIFYEGTQVLDTGFRSASDDEFYSFGPGASTRVTLVTTLGSPGSAATFVPGCARTE
jgi:hypothetical protein